MTDNNRHRLAKASAILLTGGKSSRMGRPKCLLPFDGEPLIFHVWRTLSLLFAEIIIVAAPGQELPSLKATLIRDDVAYQGPVGGIYYGLRAATGEFAFATACDVPFLNPELIAYLASIAADNDAVVPCWRNRLQPLHAFYHRRVLPQLESRLARGELRTYDLFAQARTRRVAEAEIKAFDLAGWSFFNVNTPEDYQTALARWHELKGP